MPTYDVTGRFWADWHRLTQEQRATFLAARDEFYADLHADQGFRSSLRITRVQKGKKEGVWELTWDWPNGRATFAYGATRLPGEVHVVWRRIGGHEIFDNP